MIYLRLLPVILWDVEYAYDRNGNLTSDLNRGISSITYNLLNLPVRISWSDGSTVSYRYDADGTLLREDRTIYIQTQFGPIEQIGRTAYSGGVTYQLAMAGEPAERIDFEGGFITLPDRGYHFHVRDHLGSTRAVVSLGGTLERTLDYGPYGESLGTDWAATSAPETRKLFIGKEKLASDDTELYDFGACRYDPALPRWTSVDPLAGKYPSISSYAYCAGNPVNLVDPEGANWYSYLEENGKLCYKYEDRALSKKEMKEKGYIEDLGLYKEQDGHYYSLFGMELSKSDGPIYELYKAIDQLVIRYVRSYTNKPESPFDQEVMDSSTDFSSTHNSVILSFVYSGKHFSSIKDGTLFQPVGESTFRNMVIKGDPILQVLSFPDRENHGVGGFTPLKKKDRFEDGWWLNAQSKNKVGVPLTIQFDENNAANFLWSVNQLFNTRFEIKKKKE